MVLPPNTLETGEPNFFNDYGRTKYLAEQFIKIGKKRYNRLVIVRPTNLWRETGNVYNFEEIASGKFACLEIIEC